MTIINYLWDKECYLEEYDENGVTTTTYTNEPSGFGKVISQRKSTTSRFYHYDVQGSTRQLTDENENVTDEFFYNAWGNEIARVGTTEVAFTYIGEFGYYFDDETASFYIRARNYIPLIARWISRDPLGFSGGMNLYQYVEANPINNIDPSGLILAMEPTINCPPCTIQGPRRNYPGRTPDGCSIPRFMVNRMGGGTKNCVFGSANFLDICNAHDKCYDTCFKKKAECDDEFLESLLQQCIYANNATGPQCEGFDIVKCYAVANVMVNFVKKHGNNSYEDGQNRACECYPVCNIA